MFSQGFSFQLYLVGIVDQAVEDGVGQGGVAEEVMPVCEGELAGDDGGFSVESVIEDFQQVALPIFIDGGQSPVVEDDDIDAGELFEPSGIAAVAFGDE